MSLKLSVVSVKNITYFILTVDYNSPNKQYQLFSSAEMFTFMIWLQDVINTPFCQPHIIMKKLH
jgi:hypothetical protein